MDITQSAMLMGIYMTDYSPVCMMTVFFYLTKNLLKNIQNLACMDFFIAQTHHTVNVSYRINFSVRYYYMGRIYLRQKIGVSTI